MTKQTIALGTAANDGTGDPLRDAFDKVNDNFDELYESLWRAAGSWTFSTNVGNVDFTNLGIFTEIMIIMRLLTLGTSGTRNIQVSDNNGSSFYSTSGDYQSLATTGAETAATSLATHGTASTAARSSIVKIQNFNKALIKPVEMTSGVPGIIAQAVALDAVRILPSAGGNITGGSITVYGR